MVGFLNFEPSFVSITCQPPSPSITYFVKKELNCSQLDYVFCRYHFSIIAFWLIDLRVSRLRELLAMKMKEMPVSFFRFLIDSGKEKKWLEVFFVFRVF